MKKELIVKTKNPEALDKALHSLGGVVEQVGKGNYVHYSDGTVVVRSINGNVDFLKFAIKNQGYGEVIEERDIE